MSHTDAATSISWYENITAHPRDQRVTESAPERRQVLPFLSNLALPQWRPPTFPLDTELVR